MNRLEARIRDYLAAHLELIEVGLTLVKIELAVASPFGAGGVIDVLARDRFGHLVVVEIKRSDQSARSALHEITKYVALLKASYGVPAERIVSLARRYAATRPAMILLGGSSMHKGANGWLAGRAIGCLPALTGNLGVAGGGMGPRHGGASHGQGLASIVAEDRRPPGAAVPNQMARVTEALVDGRVRVLLLLGTDMLSSFADA